jgi:CheY-like chemotaxis protein
MNDGRGGRTFRILVVEDNPADVELLRLALADADVNCDLIVIEDGEEAKLFFEQQGRFADEKAPDLAILDLNLPRYDGMELLEAMRANPGFNEVAVVVLSSSSWPREREKMKAFRVTRFIAKPPDLEEYLKIGSQLKELLVLPAHRND